MSNTDPAWEEYMYTGVDPTEGDLEIKDQEFDENYEE